MTTYERRWWWVKEKKQMALVFIIVTIMLQLQMKGCVGCLESERTGLLELKSYLMNVIFASEKGVYSEKIKEKFILKSWSHDAGNSDCCVWEGVKCKAAIGGHVVDLTLADMQYLRVANSTRPRSLNLSLLHSFPQLQTLDFSCNWFNDLFDPIHGYKSLQRLKHLRTLDLSINRLNNNALPFISAARSLRTLKLGSNKLKGVFPPEGLINLRELEELDLSKNIINGVQADNGYKSFLKKLRTLDLSANLLTNSALPFLSAARSLTTLNLGHNKLEGVFPSEEFANMTELRVLNMEGNLFGSFSVKGLINIMQLEVLDLSDNGINVLKAGYGYSEICTLLYLQELDLSNNGLTSLPDCLGNLTRLRTLDLSDNQLNGDPSSSMAALPSTLEYLSLLYNNFNGSFSFKSLANQTRLTIFRMSSKVGTIQVQAESSWVPLIQLTTLKLRHFSFGSTIPGFLAHQHDLSFVDLSQNSMTGAFPNWLVQNNTRLKTLFLKSNSLTKLQLPRIVHGLLRLEISSNRIHGSIQEDIGIVFPKMRFMNFSSNHFHGTIPSSMGEMNSLLFLDVSSNDLSGQLPEFFLSGCYSLLVLKLSNNQFHGKVFPEHANLTHLFMLYLDGNRFNGSLGKGLLNSEDLLLLDLSYNSISGTLPLWMGRMSSLICLHMRDNQVKGPFPSHLQNIKMLQVLDISHNSFSGSITRNLAFPDLGQLRLQSNEFTGSFPDTLFKNEGLRVLDLRNNNFSGIILNAVSKRSKLSVLLLRNNNFQTHIPEKLCQVLSKLDLLDLSNNKFKGVIPSCLGNMSFGAKGFNHVGSFQSITFQFEISWDYTTSLNIEKRDLCLQATPIPVVEVLTKRRYETYQGDIIGGMYGLDLSSNELSGEIPREIGNLQSIISLDFSNNHLTGSIPDSISKLKNLGSLDLSNNKLDGSIPPQLADLNSLGYFNVSFNNLSGEIPVNGHLLTFDEKSYIGNAHLCGRPTNISCNSTRSPEPTEAKEEEEEGDDLIDMVWFYWTCGAVYITTLLALFAFLCIDTHWSREWFYRVELVVHHLHLFKNRFLCK